MKLRLFVNMGFHFFIYIRIFIRQLYILYINKSKIAVGDKIFECFFLFINKLIYNRTRKTDQI